jgi:hypothetical protein
MSEQHAIVAYGIHCYDKIVEIRRRKDALYAERAEHANTEVQIRLLLELVDEMAGNNNARCERKSV